MRNPAQALAEAVRAFRDADEGGDPSAPWESESPSREADAMYAALRAYDAWKPWEDEAVVERAALLIGRRVRPNDDGTYQMPQLRDAARAALKAALGGDDA